MNLAAPAPPPERSPTFPGEPGGTRSVDVRYAVVDVETTGLDSRAHRILECAIVELDSSGVVVDEWVSLVSVPGVDELGATFVHGITRSMLAAAPTFEEILPELLLRLSGRVVVGHVLTFDADHLGAECRRVGIELPDLARAGVCTRELASLHLPAGRRSLDVCCAATGVRVTDAHTALGDARAAAGLLRWFIEEGHAPGWEDRIVAARALEWPAVSVSGARSWATGAARPDQRVPARSAPSSGAASPGAGAHDDLTEA